MNDNITQKEHRAKTAEKMLNAVIREAEYAETRSEAVKNMIYRIHGQDRESAEYVAEGDKTVFEYERMSPSGDDMMYVLNLYSEITEFVENVRVVESEDENWETDTVKFEVAENPLLG